MYGGENGVTEDNHDLGNRGKESMYEMIPFLIGAMMLLLGIIIFAAPKSCTRKDKRNNPQEVEKVKRMWWGPIILGFVMLLSGLL